jgi:hypothetical protein
MRKYWLKMADLAAKIDLTVLQFDAIFKIGYNPVEFAIKKS